MFFEMLAQPPISRPALAPKVHLREQKHKTGLHPSHRFCCPATSRCLAVAGHVRRWGWKTVQIHTHAVYICKSNIQYMYLYVLAFSLALSISTFTSVSILVTYMYTYSHVQLCLRGYPYVISMYIQYSVLYSCSDLYSRLYLSSYIHIHMYVHIPIHMYYYIYIYMVSIYLSNIHIRVHIRIHIHVHVHIHTRINSYSYSCPHSDSDSCSNWFTFIFILILRFLFMFIFIFIFLSAYIHTHIVCIYLCLRLFYGSHETPSLWSSASYHGCHSPHWNLDAKQRLPSFVSTISFSFA